MTRISASEVGEYIYCARAWWLRRVAGEVPNGQERRELGQLMHARHSRQVALSGALIWLAVVLVVVGGGLLFLVSW